MKRWICLVGILISLILMLLPEGVAMTFASGPGETIKCFYPFFSRIPLGYGNLFPAASILLSAIGAAFLLFAPRVRPAILTCLGLSILANAVRQLYRCQSGNCSVPGRGAFFAAFFL